jgi:hypothetical protein
MAYLRQYQQIGDPFLGGLFKGIVGAAKGAIGAFTGIHLGGGSPRIPTMPGVGAGGMVGAIGQIGKKGVAFVGKHKGAAAAAAAAAAGAGIAAGYIIDKNGKVRRKGHMQVTNTRALRRSMRRVEGFARIARRTMTFTHKHHLKKRRKR